MSDGFSFELLADQGVLMIRPGGPLKAEYFESMATEVDPYIEEQGGLHGIMIFAESFPGWEDFSAFTSHIRFVKGHHEKIGRVAFCTDDSLISIFPAIAKHFVSAEIKLFSVGEKDEALAWAAQG